MSDPATATKAPASSDAAETPAQTAPAMGEHCVTDRPTRSSHLATSLISEQLLTLRSWRPGFDRRDPKARRRRCGCRRLFLALGCLDANAARSMFLNPANTPMHPPGCSSS